MAKQYKTGFIITGDASGGIRAIKATDDQLEKLNRETRQSAKDSRAASAGWQSMTTRTAALTAAVGLSAGGIAAMAISQTRAIAETAALARTLEVSTGTLQEWQYAGEQVGINADKMGDIFKDVSDKIGDFAATGGGEAADLFEQLNLDINKLIKLAPDQQLLAIADAVNQIDDPARRVFFLESIADDASRLLPLMENNAKALREYSAEARSLGVALDQEDVARAVEADRAMRQLTAAAQGLTNQLVVDLAPGLSAMTDSLTAFIQEAGSAEEVLEGLANTAGTLATVYLARRLGPALATLSGQFIATSRVGAAAFGSLLGPVGGVNRALVITQGRIAAVSLASRGLVGVMGLLGGPLGVAIIAAGAIAIYHEELDAMLAPAQRATQRVDDLTNAINLNSEAAINGQLVNLTGQMVELERQAAQAKNALEEINASSRDPGPFRNSIVMGEDAADRREAYAALRQSREELSANSEAASVLRQRLEKLREQGVAPVVDSITDLALGTADLSKTQSEAQRAADAFGGSLRALENQLFPLEKTQRDLAQSQILLQTALMKGEISIGRYLSAFDRLQQSALSSENWQDAYGLNGDGAQELDKMSDAARDLGFTFSSAFEDAIIGGKGFREVLGGIAEDIARIALRKSVTQPIAGWLGTAISGVAAGFGGGSAGAYAGGTVGSLYAEGGYTGPGGKFEPAGIVHAGEYVIQKDVVERPGVRDFLDRLNTSKGYASGGYVGPAPLPAAINQSPTAPGVTIPVEVNVTAQPGMSSQETARQGSEMGRALKATVLTIIQNEKRPGGALASVRG